MNLWTKEEIYKILIQLDRMKLPFKNYSFVQENGELKLLGSGGSADVYEAKSRISGQKKYAIKVIGFRSQNMDSTEFDDSVWAQRDILTFPRYVVKIYAHKELWITFDENDHIVSAEKKQPVRLSRTSLKLQFIVMEKMTPVIKKNRDGSRNVIPEALEKGEEKEILKLAYDIGTALKEAHHNKTLHRDIKLENVFYSEKKKKYELGDFGISKKTRNGFAGTVAFTKGYAAPEVRGTEERYDYTADIYSFGIMLYVLTNHLKFPDSNTYSANPRVQYTPGYVLPEPEGDISEALYDIIARACMYDPDDRYQSIEEMLLDIETLLYGEDFGFKKEYKRVYLVVGLIMLALGVGAWKLTLVPEMIIRISFLQYIFLAGCLGKGIFKILKKDTTFISVIIFAVGVYLMISSGFSWLKLFFLLWMTSSSGMHSGVIASGILIVNFISLLQSLNGMNLWIYSGYGWIAVTLISIAYILLAQYSGLVSDGSKIKRLYYQKEYYWVLVCIDYALIFIFGCLLETRIQQGVIRVFGYPFMIFLYNMNLKMVGLCGFTFCFLWIAREKILIWYRKRDRKRV